MKKLNLQKIKAVWMGLWQKMKNAVMRRHQQFQALPIEQRKNLIKNGILFVSGVLCGVLLTLGIQKVGNSEGESSSDSTSATASANATDWGDLVAGMCQTTSPVNLLAMKLDFPFSQCMRDNGQINGACVQADAKQRFQASLPAPYQQNVGAVETKLSSSEDGSNLMYYLFPLKDAVFQQLPLTALAVQINTKAGSPSLGWQTPHLVIQGDYSTIKGILAQYAPAPQTVYYAHLPANSDALPGPFATLDEAKMATRRAGGRTSLIKKHQVTLDASFLDGLNEVALSCVSQPVR